MRHLSALRIAILRPAAALLALVGLALGTAAPAFAGTTNKILEICSEGHIPRGYSQQAYDQALHRMPPELSEYSDCPALIHKAQLAAATAGGGGGGAGGPGVLAASTATPPSPSEQHALERATHHGNGAVRIGGEAIHPGVVHVDVTSALSTLPTPLLALLAFLAACALWLLGRVLAAHLRSASRHEGPR